MKVGVTTVVSLNPGDAAILVGTVELLRQAFGPNIEVVAFDKDADTASRCYPWMCFHPPLTSGRSGCPVARWVARRGYGHWVVRMRTWRLRLAAKAARAFAGALARVLLSKREMLSLREYLSCDLILASGGTYLVPAYNVDPHLTEYELIQALGRPLGVMPQSVGAYSGHPMAGRLANVLRQCVFVMVRDPQSRDNLLAIGVESALMQICPDAAFALARDQFPFLGPKRRAKNRRVRVAVSVREWKHYSSSDPNHAQRRYFDALAGLTAWLARSANAELTFISSCQGVPDYWTDDAKTADLVVARLPADVAHNVTVDRSFRGPEQLMEALCGFDVIVATRMHVAILGLCASIPVLPIAYEFKTRELFEMMGLGELVCDIDDCSSTAMIERMRVLLEDESKIEKFNVGRANLKGRVFDAVATLRDWRARGRAA